MKGGNAMQNTGGSGFWGSLRGRLFGLVLLASVPMAALVVYNALEAREVVVKEAAIRLNTAAKEAAADLESHIRGARHLLSVLAEVPSVRRAEQPACGRLLGELVQRAPRDTELSLTVAARDGLVVCSWTSLTGPVDLSNRDYLKEALATRNASVGRPVISRISNTARLPVAHPILDPAGEVERLVTAAVSLERLAAQFMASPVLAGATFSIWDERGTVLFRHPDNKRWFGTVHPVAGIVKALTASKGTRTVEAAGLDGVRRVYALADLDDFPQLGLTISAGISKETLTAEADRALRNDLALLALILAAALAGAWSLGEVAIRRRVAAVIQVASRIAGGKLETRIGGPYGGGELGQLARAFDEMAVAMQRQVEDIRRGEEEIRALNVELEQRVVDRTRQLEAANKELEAFSYSVSHDLRSPLRAIDGFSRVLQEDHDDKLNDEARRVLGIIRDSTQKMGQLIDDLLSFSRFGRKPLSAAAIDMNRLVKDVLIEIGAASGRAPKVKLGALPMAHGDAVLVKQVWSNLLSNAVKFSGRCAQPVIEVSGRENGEENIYSVKDNGAGFDMQYYDKLFGVFQRLHGADEFYGTGVGLAIVQRVVLRHGGRVWAEGKVDEGAAFYFSLPRGTQDG